MKRFYADKKSLNFLRVAIFLALVLLAFVLNIALDYVERVFPQYIPKFNISVPEIVWWALIVLFIIAYVIFILIILPLWYKTVRFTLYTDEIEVKYGFFSKTNQYMKLSAVQYTTKVSFPLSKFTSFNFIFLNALGGRVMLMFLSDRDAEYIAKKIDNYIESRCGL